MLGGQLGCNYQFASNWVAGIEGSLAAADINGTGHDPFFTGIGDDVLKVKTDWLASVTGPVRRCRMDPSNAPVREGRRRLDA